MSPIPSQSMPNWVRYEPTKLADVTYWVWMSPVTGCPTCDRLSLNVTSHRLPNLWQTEFECHQSQVAQPVTGCYKSQVPLALNHHHLCLLHTCSASIMLSSSPSPPPPSSQPIDGEFELWQVCHIQFLTMWLMLAGLSQSVPPSSGKFSCFLWPC